MYCVYRIKVEEYVPGYGWKDDGSIYSLDKHGLESEAARRKVTSYRDHEQVKIGRTEIVKVNESILGELRKTPVLSTRHGVHPADEGTLAEHKETFRYMNAIKYPLKTSNAPAAR